MEDSGKKGLRAKLKETLHIGHSSKASNASDDSGYASHGQVRSFCHTIGVQLSDASTMLTRAVLSKRG